MSYATENKDQACIQLLLKAGAAAMSSLALLGDVEEGGIVGAGGKQRELQGDVERASRDGEVGEERGLVSVVGVEGSVESMMGALVVVEARGSNKEQSQGVRCTLKHIFTRIHTKTARPTHKHTHHTH